MRCCVTAKGATSSRETTVPATMVENQERPVDTLMYSRSKTERPAGQERKPRDVRPAAAQSPSWCGMSGMAPAGGRADAASISVGGGDSTTGGSGEGVAAATGSGAAGGTAGSAGAGAGVASGAFEENGHKLRFREPYGLESAVGRAERRVRYIMR